MAMTMQRDVKLTVLTSLFLISIWTTALKRPSTCPLTSALLINCTRLRQARAHTHSCLHIPLALKNQHITIDGCPSQSLTGLSSSLRLWCSIRFFRWSAGGDGGCEGQYHLPGLLINWPLKSTRLRFYTKRGQVVERVQGCLIKRPRCARPLCVGSLIFLSVNCHSKYLLPHRCPALAPSWPPTVVITEERKRSGRGFLRPPLTHHSSNHLIRAAFDECAEWRQRGSSLPVTDWYIRTGWTVKEANNSGCWNLPLLIFQPFCENMQRVRAAVCVVTETVKWCSGVYTTTVKHGKRFLNAEQVERGGNCPRSVLTRPFSMCLRERPRCWAHVSWPSKQHSKA